MLLSRTSTLATKIREEHRNEQTYSERVLSILFFLHIRFFDRPAELWKQRVCKRGPSKVHHVFLQYGQRRVAESSPHRMPKL